MQLVVLCSRKREGSSSLTYLHSEGKETLSDVMLMRGKHQHGIKKNSFTHKCVDYLHLYEDLQQVCMHMNLFLTVLFITQTDLYCMSFSEIYISPHILDAKIDYLACCHQLAEYLSSSVHGGRLLGCKQLP